MLLQHAHTVNGHAALGRFAHVMDGQQRHLHGGEGFHFNAGGADDFYRFSAIYAANARPVCASSF